MAKKILFITFLFFSNFSFSQKRINKLSVYPNPFTFSTKITFESDNEKNVLLIVKDVLGKTVYREEYPTRIGKNSISFFKDNLGSGVYILAIQNSKELISKRFVIK